MTLILGPVINTRLTPFLLSINDLSSASKLLDPITFADYTNLFRSDYDGNTPLPNVNKELQKINKELISNKLYLNVRKTTQVK